MLKKITLKCGTILTLDALEDAGLSYVPCGIRPNEKGEDTEQPLLKYAHLWGSRKQVTRKSYGQKWYGYKALEKMTGVQLMTGWPTYKPAPNKLFYHYVSIDIERHMIETLPDLVDQIVEIYRENITGTPCEILTKSGGLRLDCFSYYLGNKMSFANDGGMLLEILAGKCLTRIDARYAMRRGNLLDLPFMEDPEKRPLQQIVDIGSTIATKSSTGDATERKVVETSQISTLEIQWAEKTVQKDDKTFTLQTSQLFPSEYCPLTSHASNRDEVRFTKYPDGSVDGRCFNCGETWWEVKKPPQKPIQHKNFHAAPNTDVTPEIIATAPVFEDHFQQSFPHFSTEEKIIIRNVLNENPDAGWIPTGEKNVPAWILKYNQLHRLTGEFALNGQPAEVEKQRVWLSQFTKCEKCGGIAAKWINRYLLTAGYYCNDCHKDVSIGSYLEYELNRKLPNSIISTNDTKYLGDDPEYADFRLWEPGMLTNLAAAMGTGKTTEIDRAMAMLADQQLGIGIIAVPRISLARFLAHYLRSRDGFNAWGLWHEGVARGNKFIGTTGAICCVPSLPAVIAEANGANTYIAIDEIDFSYSLLSLTVTQAPKVKQILREAVRKTGLVVAGQTESTLALEAFAAEIEAEQVQGFYKNATPSDNGLTVYQYPAVDGKNKHVLSGAENAIRNALEDGKNVYTFTSSRRYAEILEKHFEAEVSPVLYDAYTKGQPRPDAILKNQRVTDTHLFIATSAADVGISISDPDAHTVLIPTLVHGSLNCNSIVQTAVRDRGLNGGSLHYTDYNFQLPVNPSTATGISLFHEALKAAEDANVFFPKHSIEKIAAAQALGSLADTQPKTFLKYHLSTVAQIPIDFRMGECATEAEIDRITTTRTTLLKNEREAKQTGAIAVLKSQAVMTAEQIRRKSNAGALQKSERLSQEFANTALQAAGWNQEEFPDAEVVNIAMELIAAGVQIEGLEKQRRGFYAIQFPQWTAGQLDKERLLAYRERVEHGKGLELTAIPDDRFLGELLRALLDKLQGVQWTETGIADAIRETLHSTVRNHEGCKGASFLANLKKGAGGSTLSKKSRFLHLTDDTGIVEWASELIATWYPARIAKRGEARGLQISEQMDVILKCFRSWGIHYAGTPPDKWHITEYQSVALPDPNAAAIAHAQELRRDGHSIEDIAARVQRNISTVSRWCRGIDPKARARQHARDLRKQGMKQPDIAKRLGYSIPTIRKWCMGINPNARKELEAKRLKKEGRTHAEIATELGVTRKTVTTLFGKMGKK